ncbi:hypothetical protein [Novosphingobium sp.]|jgi:hypothetical protein|uniref:hypothetical protein n=1 Tax=Novosphingobium sp. TaxID=1874826 RepID=UPI002FE25918
MRKVLMTLVAGCIALQGEAGHCEITSYAYDALGRLVVVVGDRGETATRSAVYWYDSASNRSRVLSANSSTEFVPVFRYVNPGAKHFYTHRLMEGIRAGLSPEGWAFTLYRQPGIDLAQVYRCYVPSTDDQFMSRQSNCEGQTVEGTLGYVRVTAASGLNPLYRLFKASISDHLITINYDEAVNAGYAYESVVGYVP